MVDLHAISPSPDSELASRSKSLSQDILRRGPQEAAIMLARESPDSIARALTLLPTAKAVALLPRFDAALRAAVLKAVTAEQRQQWLQNERYPKGSLGRLMEPVVAIFRPTVTVCEAIQALREMVKAAFITYAYVIDEHDGLIGVVAMRELLLAQPTQKLQDIMIERPFSLNVTQRLTDVLPLVHTRHFPEYPICDHGGHLIGIVRGYALFYEQVLEISAQPGRMVGVDRAERIQTNPWRSIHFRHPWLQLNLVSSF